METFGKHLDGGVWEPYDNRVAFAVTVELKDVQHLERHICLFRKGKERERGKKKKKKGINENKKKK
jgi:hypothetical protein